MEFKRIQLSGSLRHMNSIEVVKIADIEEGGLILERFNGKREKFPVLYSARYKIGEYLDMVFFNTGNSSHGMKFIGHTPPQFYPNAEEKGDCI